MPKISLDLSVEQLEQAALQLPPKDFLRLMATLLERLDELEDEMLMSDPEVLERLKEARQNHLEGRVLTHEEMLKELGLSGQV